MKAVKVTVNINVEVLHIDSAPYLIEQASEKIADHYPAGSLTSDDGDTVTWETTNEGVTF